MQPPAAHQTHRCLRALGLVAAVLLVLGLGRALATANPASAQSAASGMPPSLSNPNNQADNCIITTGIIPATPLPTATAAPTVNPGGPYNGFVGQPIYFTGSATPARNSSLLTCIWSFGDGRTTNFLTANHTYAAAGTYTATLTVTDSGGAVATASSTVTISPLAPLCQEPAVTGNAGAYPCTASSTCPSLSATVATCAPLCPATGEVLVGGNCPPPPSNNILNIVNGPYNLQVDQPITVQVNLNMSAFSSLSNGDTITFDFGDKYVITNVAPGLTTTALGANLGSVASTCLPGGAASSAPVTTQLQTTTGNVTSITTSTSPGGAAGGAAGARLPAQTTAAHAYTQPGSYVVTVIATLNDCSRYTAQTIATVAGSAAPAPAAAPASAPAAPTQSIALSAGCNSVTLTFPDGTPISTVLAAVQGANVTSIWETPNNAPPLGYYADPSIPSNLAAVYHGDTVSICVDGNATLVDPAS